MAYHDSTGAHLSFTRRDNQDCERIKGRVVGAESKKWTKVVDCGTEGVYDWPKATILEVFGLDEASYEAGQVEFKIKSIIHATEDCPKLKSSGRKVTSSFQ